MIKSVFQSRCKFYLTFAFLIVCCLACHATLAADRFAPKSITIMITSDAGEGADMGARLTGPLLSKYLPGNPSIVYLNVPGASGIKGINDFVSKAKPDGLTSIVGIASGLDPTTLRNPSVRYDTKKLLMYGAFPSPNAPLVLRKDAADRLHDKTKKPVIMGSVSATRNTDQMAVWAPRYLGWNVRWVLGYKSSPEMVLAAIRGEIDMICMYDVNLIKQMTATGQFTFPVQTGVMKDGKFVADGEYGDAQVFSDIIKPLLKDSLEKKAFASWEAIVQIGKWFALPPDTPDDIVAIYRQAFDRAVVDPAFAPEASKVFGDNYTVMSGKDMQKMTYVADQVTDGELAFYDDLREQVGIHVDRKN